nr:hypothetical protein [Prevotella sp.]
MMKTQYVKPEIHMVLLENMLMNYTSWTVDNANDVNDPEGNDHGHIFGPDTDWDKDPSWGGSSNPFDSDNW